MARSIMVVTRIKGKARRIFARAFAVGVGRLLSRRKRIQTEEIADRKNSV